MALINCPVCSKRISDKSSSCICCGFPTASNQVDSNSPDNNSQRQRNSVFSALNILWLLIIFIIGAWLITGYDNYTEKTKLYGKEQSELNNEETSQVRISLSDSGLTQIPMLLSGSGEHGRYFLLLHVTYDDTEHIKYMRRGNESDAYGQMHINCTDNKIIKNSSERLDALKLESSGSWHTPIPDWTDQDIVNFICGK